MALKRIIRLAISFVFVVGIVVSTITTQSPQSAYADDPTAQAQCDYNYYENNDFKMYDPCAPDCSASSVNLSNIKNANYLGTPVLNSAEITAIAANQPFYQKSSTATGVPWQLLAAIHYRETHLKQDDPNPYQIGGYTASTTGSANDQFQAATDAAAAFIKNKMGDGYDYTQPDNVKKALFAYNGTGDVYIKQATALGFTDTQAANGEGSPYVMNRADAKRDPTLDPTKSNSTWGQIKSDGGPIAYPANSDYGAYVIYAILAGVDASSGASCSFSGNGLTFEQAQKFVANYLKIDQGDPNGDRQYVNPAEVCDTGTDNCVAMSAFFINKYTDLKVATPNGSAVVGELAARNSGLQVGTTPQPMSIFSVATGKTMCGDKLCGHTGVVLGINPDKDEIYTAEAAWCNPGFTSAYVHKLSAWTNSGYTFAYAGSHVKQDVLMKDIQ